MAFLFLYYDRLDTLNDLTEENLKAKYNMKEKNLHMPE